MIRVLKAFFLKDLYTAISYRLPFALNLFAIFFTLTVVYFVAQFVGLDDIVLKDGSQPVDYFAYVVIGVAAMDYLTMALRAFSVKFRSEQLTGTLEALIATPASLPTILCGMVSWDFVMSSFFVVIYILGAIFLFGMPVAWTGFFGFFIALLLTVLATASLGIMAAGFTMAFKRGEAINRAIVTVSLLFGGVLFPASQFPEWLQWISRFVPLTYSLEAMRASLLGGASLVEVMPSLGVLALFGVILMPLSLWIFSLSVDIARRNGTLVQY